MAGKKNILLAFILVTFYIALSVLYFVTLDQRFYITNLLTAGINMAVPVPYILLVVIFAYFYSLFFKQDLKTILLPVIVMAIVLSLTYLLTNLKLEIRSVNPFSGNRNVYRIYVEGYYLLWMSLFAILGGMFYRGLLKGGGLYFPDYTKAHNVIFHLPVLVYFALAETILALNGCIMHSLAFLILFLVSLTFDGIRDLFKNIKSLLTKFVGNRMLFLACIFILAFLIRYFWGMRLMAITGENFIKASDDGVAYDPMAAMLANGKILPRDSTFALNGFGYWYFMAAVYKIFGPHNFKALVAVQSAIGAVVPVFIYLISQRIFKIKLVAAGAALLACFNMTLIFLSVVMGMEALYIPLFLLAVTATAYFFSTDAFDYKKAFLSGSLFGIANNVRGELLFAPFLLIFLIYVFMRDKTKMKSIVFMSAVLFAGFLLFASIQHVVNYSIYGEYHLSHTALKTNYVNDKFTGENLILDKMGFNPFKSMGSSLKAFTANPALISELIFKGFSKRWLIYYLQPNFGVFDPIFLINPASGYLFKFPLYLQFYGYIFILYGIFFSLCKRENLMAKVMLLTLALHISSMYAFVLVHNSRNKGVLIPLSALFFAYGASIFCQRLKGIYHAQE